MLANMLTLAAIMAGRLAASTEPVLLEPLAREVAGRGRRPARPSHAFVVDVPAGLPPVEGDPELLAQVLRNLYENAVKYSPGGGEIRTTAVGGRRTRHDPRRRRRASASPPSRSTDVFERFRRAGADPTVRGMGLGLYLSRHLVEAQGGRIAASSPGPGRGATFAVTLPVARGWTSAPDADERRGDGNGGMVRKHLILVVDDEPAIVRLVRAKLQADGYAVITAGRGEEALAHARGRAAGPGRARPDDAGHGRLRDAAPDPDAEPGAGHHADRARRRRRQAAGACRAAPTTTSPSRSTRTSSRPGSRRCCAGPPGRRPPAGGRPCATRASRSTWSGGGSRVGGEEVRLSRTEWELLAQLAGNAGRVMLHGELLSRIWGPEFRDEAHYLRTWVSRLRAKLEPDAETPALITTFPGLGYRLEAPPAE